MHVSLIHSRDRLLLVCLKHVCTEAVCDGFRLSGKQQLSGSLKSGAM
jgi:hypothetical protein